MELPFELREALETLTAGQSQARLARTSQTLSERYRTQSGQGRRLLSTDDEAAVYAAARMPATCCAILTALRSALKHEGRQFSSLLDAGAGTGAASWAALQALPDLQRVVCIEREASMRRVGQRLAQAGPDPLRGAEWLDADLSKGLRLPSSDLIIASYVLGEMAEDERTIVAEALWNATEKMLLVVEPGTPAGFTQINRLRSRLLSLGAHIAAPCTHEGTCLIPEEDWCHFTCRVSRSRMHRVLKGGDAPYEDEKFIYMAFSKAPCDRAKARVLRHPVIEPGRVTLTLCTPESVQQTVSLKRDGEAFKRARKANCGDEV